MILADAQKDGSLRLGIQDIIEEKLAPYVQKVKICESQMKVANVDDVKVQPLTITQKTQLTSDQEEPAGQTQVNVFNVTDEKIDEKISEHMKKAHYITIEEMEALIDKKMKLQKDFDKKVQTGRMELIGELAKQLSLALQRINKLEKKLATYSEISTEIQEMKQ